MKTIKAAQDNGQTILVCDMGRAFDVMAAKAAGVDVGRVSPLAQTQIRIAATGTRTELVFA